MLRILVATLFLTQVIHSSTMEPVNTTSDFFQPTTQAQESSLTNETESTSESTALSASQGLTTIAPTTEVVDDCSDNLTSLVDPLHYFAVTQDCVLLVSKGPINRQRLAGHEHIRPSSPGSPCILQLPIVFQWSGNEIAVIHYHGTTANLTIYFIDSIRDEIEFDLGDTLLGSSTSLFDMPVSEVTCHSQNHELTKMVVCYSFASTTPPTIQMNTYSHNSSHGAYEKTSSWNFTLPHYVNIHIDKLMAYEEFNTTKVWMQSRLNWITSLDTADHRTHNRNRLSIYHLENPSRNTHLLFSDAVGLTTANCNGQNEKCTYRFHLINKKSALTSSCLVKYDYLIRFGVIARRKHVPTPLPALAEETTAMVPVLPQPAALHQTADDSNGATGVYVPLDPDYDAYKLMVALCLIVFVYLLLYFGLLLIPYKSTEIEYMRSTYADLEVLADELGLSWSQFVKARPELQPEQNPEEQPRAAVNPQKYPYPLTSTIPMFRSSSSSNTATDTDNTGNKKMTTAELIKAIARNQPKEDNTQESMEDPLQSHTEVESQKIVIKSSKTQGSDQDKTDQNEYKLSLQPPETPAYWKKKRADRAGKDAKPALVTKKQKQFEESTEKQDDSSAKLAIENNSAKPGSTELWSQAPVVTMNKEAKQTREPNQEQGSAEPCSDYMDELVRKSGSKEMSLSDAKVIKKDEERMDAGRCEEKTKKKKKKERKQRDEVTDENELKKREKQKKKHKNQKSSL